ncbi:hypothetical protein F443_18119 [Phytophthora nicotianae P1569]|uniref:Uncharacterized protein n=1 Tax=Phytophthora nicotianae P1569 TaxID=1317065 RepID=V9EAM3_PHYNI|nr:hypothetical protein F443_18119 [Phytophthora nicotianae P1569]
MMRDELPLVCLRVRRAVYSVAVMKNPKKRKQGESNICTPRLALSSPFPRLVRFGISGSEGRETQNHY